MLKDQIRENQICPLCQSVYFDAPALSRMDGKTAICPDCGIRQSLDSIGVPKDEQDEILQTIHRYIKR